MADQPRKKRQTQESSPELAVVDSIFRGIGRLFSLLFGRGKIAAHRLNAKVAVELADHWSAIDAHLSHPTTYSVAVTEADKIFDATLQELGVAGKNLGERLQNARALFTAELYQQIWNAHKLRNMIAHEVGTVVQSQEAQGAIATFRRALRELGVPV